MRKPQTEALHDLAKGLDDLPLVEIASVLADGQAAAAMAVRASLEVISRGGVAMAKTIRSGGVLHYVAAGSSGLMAAADALELGGTFSIPDSQIRIHMAGGLPTGSIMLGNPEDDTSGVEVALAEVSPRDTIISVSASGSTPYTLAAATAARAKGANVVAIANNPGSALLKLADQAICLSTPPEIVAGSTRMGAGTAQKIALNMLSTLMAVELGHVHDGMMVNLHADNVKLRDRAQHIVCSIAGVDADAAGSALDDASGLVKPAILIAALGVTVGRANEILRETEGNLRVALARQT